MPQSADSYGDTRSKEGVFRRVFICNVPINSNLDDFMKAFGGQDILEGAAIKKHSGFVQFKRPNDYTYALTLDNQLFFNGIKLKIRPFKVGPKPTRHMSPDYRASSPPLRRRPISRSRSRSRSPDKSWVGNGRNDYSRQSRNERDGYSLSRSRDTDHSRTNRNAHRHDDTLKRLSSPEAAQLFRNHNIDSRFPETREFRVGDPSDLMQPGDMRGRRLPVDIELTLKQVIEHKTASKLSTIQLASLVDYFKSEMINASKNSSLYRG